MVTRFIVNPDRDETVIVHEERFDGLLDHTQALRNEALEDRSDMQLRAMVPGILLEQYCLQNGVPWYELFEPGNRHIKRILDENPYFYTSDKRL